MLPANIWQRLDPRLRSFQFFARRHDKMIRKNRLIRVFSLLTAFAIVGWIRPVSSAEDRSCCRAQVAQGFPVAPESSSQGMYSSQPVDRNVEAVQRLLERLKFYEGDVTGVNDPKTKRAIQEFQKQAGLSTDGQITPDLLRELRNRAWKSGGWKAGHGRGQDEVLDATGIKEAQNYLLELGFVPGPNDGTYGPQTQSAVESFQADQGAVPDGLVTRTTLSNMKRAVQLKGKQTVATLHLLNWPDYIDPDVLSEFENSTKVKVVLETMGSYDDMEKRIKDVRNPVDIIFPGGDILKILAARGDIALLDKSKLPNLKYLDPEIQHYMDSYDEDGKYSVPYLWYSNGIAVNKTKLSKSAPGLPIDSIKLIFDKANASKTARCGGIIVNDAPEDVIPFALAYLGKSMSSTNINDLKAVGPLFKELRPYIKVVSNDDFADTLAKGKACVALGYSGDVVQAIDADEAASKDLVFNIPSEGSMIGMDAVAIVATSDKKPEALAFINHISDPHAAARITKFAGYGNGNAGSKKFIDPALLSNPMIYPPPEKMKLLIARPPLSPEMKEEFAKIWKNLN
jgi:putrescine transport system substrate-binding protein